MVGFDKDESRLAQVQEALSGAGTETGTGGVESRTWAENFLKAEQLVLSH